MSLSARSSDCVGIGGLSLWWESYALHIVLIPSSYGMLVYRIVTSTETMIVCYGTSMKLMKLMNSLGRGPY